MVTATMENEGHITLLNDIDALSTNYTIKVKIVSLWRKKMRGTKIQASCLHKLFSKFERHLNVDECLIIKRPSLVANTASFKIVPNNQKLSFYYHTFVEKCNKWEGPQYVFNYVDFNDVLSQKIKEGTTVDFIGYVVVCYKIEETNKKDGSKGKSLNLKLQDLEDVQIDLTLWDDYAKDMYSYMVSEKREAHVVVVVHFGAVKTYKGKWAFLITLMVNDFSLTTILMRCYRSRKSEFLSKLAASTESSSHAGSYMMCYPKKVVVVGTIVAIVSDKMWYYDGCNYCKSKVEQKFETYDKDDGTSDVRDEKLYQCSNKDCNGTEVFPLSRFKLPIRVQDSTGTVTLTLFDHETLKFVGKTAKELIEIQDELPKTNEIPREYPVEFETLVNLKCAFVIKVTDFNIVNAVENYGISVVTTDDDILDKLNKKWKIDQLDVSDSFGMSQSEFQSAGGENPSFSKKSRSLPAGTVQSPTSMKVDVQETSRKRDASQFMTMQYILPRNYYNWVTDFNLAPNGMVQIITTDRRIFTVRVRKAGSSYFFHDGWFNMIQSLLLPNKSLLLFQYEAYR
ncbi:putative nucleic acid-binding, replication factor A [Helianthus annuus]|nr:putative nucleic acid-binding, replication factor A [Helianthus annuus]KAJ0639658.1 putative nucleic acid-binding, replication factor A [Helianthus annuus]